MIKQVCRDLIIRSLIFFGNHDKDSFVLSYHDVDENYKLTPGIFEYQLKYYMKHGYRFVSNIYDLKVPKKILVTFDDGYVSFYEYVLPILEKYNVPCLLFIPTKFLGGNLSDGISKTENQQKKIISMDILREISRSELVTVGCHTHEHLDMTRNDLMQIRKDMKRSLSVIEPVIGKKCKYFCYPQGKLDSEVKGLLHEMGFEYAFTTEERAFSHCTDFLEIPRYAGDYFLNDLFLDISRNSNCNLYMKMFSQ